MQITAKSSQDKESFLTLSESTCISSLWPQHGTIQIEIWPLSWQFCSMLWHLEAFLEHYVKPSSSCCLQPAPFLYLDFIRDKLISHGYQWRCSARTGHSRVWEEHSLKSDVDLEKKKIPSPPYNPFPPMYYTSLITRHLSEEDQCVVGLPSHHWDWQQRSHLITLTGIWEVSAIKWSGAIK